MKGLETRHCKLDSESKEILRQAQDDDEGFDMTII